MRLRSTVCDNMALPAVGSHMDAMVAASKAPAPFGALDPQVASDILCLRDLFLERRVAIAKMTGRPSWRDPLRDELLRLVVINHASGKVEPSTHYYMVCKHYGSTPVVRRKIGEMVRLGLLTLVPSGSDRRSTEVWPTERLISTYNSEIPAFRSKVIEILRDYL